MMMLLQWCEDTGGWWPGWRMSVDISWYRESAGVESWSYDEGMKLWYLPTNLEVVIPSEQRNNVENVLPPQQRCVETENHWSFSSVECSLLKVSLFWHSTLSSCCCSSIDWVQIVDDRVQREIIWDNSIILHPIILYDLGNPRGWSSLPTWTPYMWWRSGAMETPRRSISRVKTSSTLSVRRDYLSEIWGWFSNLLTKEDSQG